MNKTIRDVHGMHKIVDCLPITKSTIYEPPPHVMPYLPKEAEDAIVKHEKYNRQPAFVMAFERMPAQCPNCGGLGEVMVRFCDGGPYKEPRFARNAVKEGNDINARYVPASVTYFEGNGQFPEGWYKIKEIRTWICPNCGDQNNLRGK